MSSKYCGLHVILMTNYPFWLRLPWLLTELLTNYADYLGYELLGWVMSLSSILPTPSLDHSTSPGGQSPSSFCLVVLLPPWQAALWHYPLIKVELHCSVSFQGWRWTSSWTWGRCRVPHGGRRRAGTACRHGSQAGIAGFGPAGLGQLQWQQPCSFALQPGW